MNRSYRAVPTSCCPLCGAPALELYRHLADALFKIPGEWGLNRCSSPQCGLVWQVPFAESESVSDRYPFDYYTHVPVRERNAIGRAVLNAYLRVRFGYRTGSRVGALLAPVAIAFPGGGHELGAEVMFLPAPSHAGARVLEVGCGGGDLLARLLRLGWVAEGVDFDPIAVRRCQQRGILAYTGELRDQKYPDESFDAVVLSHVLEHVADPIEFLIECRRVLVAGGRLVVLTPNTDSWGHSVFGRDWLGLEAPRHLFIFNIATLSEILRRSGFEQPVVKTTYRGARGFISFSILFRHERLKGTEPSVWKRRLAALSMQLVERCMSVVRPNCGEELLAVAIK